jgi:microcystin-dependent protein
MCLPVGTIVGMIGVNPNSPPSGWLYCNGSTFDGQTYPRLASIFPNNTLPNLVGLTLMGASVGGSYPASSQGFGGGNQQNPNGTYGSAQHTMALEEMPSHQHFGFGENFSGWPLGTNGAFQFGSAGGIDQDNFYFGTMFTGGTNSNTTSAQPNNAFSLIQPTYAIYFFIRASLSNPGAGDV